jgi:hypothetical protein
MGYYTRRRYLRFKGVIKIQESQVFGVLQLSSPPSPLIGETGRDGRRHRVAIAINFNITPHPLANLRH